MTHSYTIDRITGYLRNYDPIKHHFCLLSYTETSCPLIVPQESLIRFDDFLLPCNIPTQIVKPLTVIKHRVSSPHDKYKLYYTAFAKQSHSNHELIFFSAKINSYMVQTEHKAEHKPPPSEHMSPSRNTSKKLSSVFNNGTLREITYLPIYWSRTNETPQILSSPLLHCHDRTHKLLQPLDLDSQRITQSFTTLFTSSNLH